MKESLKYDLPVVVMAGGEGTRLRPLTLTTPKPMIPVGGTTLADLMMDTFSDIGCRRFYLSLNYHADQIEEYYKTNNPRGREYTFFREDKPLGSGGPLSLIRENLDSTFIVGCCDIVLDRSVDFRKVVDYHRTAGNEITVVVALLQHKLAYGNMVVDERGRLIRMEEKPTYTFRVNTAIYVLEPHVLKALPYNEYTPMTTLIDEVIQGGGRVGCYEIEYDKWRDAGTWEDYEWLKAKYVGRGNGCCA